MIKEPKYLIKFTNAYNDNGTVWYTISVFNSKEDESWSFKERYSQMRNIHENCQKTKWKNSLPDFPPRKMFGNTKEEFIQKRKKELENYYTTLFRSVDIEEFPELVTFFSTNKPVKQKIKPVVKIGQHEQAVKPQKKQKQLKKVFEQIVAKSEEEMVQSNDFDHEIDDETRRKFNQQFNKLKLELKSPILQNHKLPKGLQDNDADFWSMFFHDQHEQRLTKIKNISKEVVKILKDDRICNIKFVLDLGQL